MKRHEVGGTQYFPTKPSYDNPYVIQDVIAWVIHNVIP